MTLSSRFILNGLLQANVVLGEDIFKVEDWKVIGEYVYDAEGGRHQAFYAPVRDIEVLGVKIRAGERVQVEQSLKYSSEEAQRLWSTSGLEEISKWSASRDSYSKSASFSTLLKCFEECAMSEDIGCIGNTNE